MIWQNFTELRKDLTQLKSRASGLSEEMVQAAERLQSGGVGPSNELMEQLEAYRNSFQQVTSLLGKSSSLKTSEINSLDELELIIDNEESRQKSLDVVDSVLQIIHTENADFVPLKQLQNGANELRELISSGGRHLSNEDLNRRIADYQSLINLVSTDDQLTDEEWDIAFDKVTTTFGRALSTAAVRKRLTVDVMAG